MTMEDIQYHIIYYAMYLLYALVILFIFRLLFGKRLKKYHSNWNTLIDDFDFSTKEFYRLLTEELSSHGIRNIRIEETSINEGSVFSHSRLYLRVRWKGFQYDLCGAKFGNGFFVSWWLFLKFSFGQVLIASIPLIGGWLDRKLYPVTHYTQDTASMFMTYCQQSVLTVVDQITAEKGSRRLSELDRKPVQRDVFKR